MSPVINMSVFLILAAGQKAFVASFSWEACIGRPLLV